MIAAILFILNEAPKERLGRNYDGTIRSSLQAATAIRFGRLLLQVMLGQEKAIIVEWNNAERLCNIAELQYSLDDMHKQVPEHIYEKRRFVIAAHDAKTNIVTPKFSLAVWFWVAKQSVYRIGCHLFGLTHDALFRSQDQQPAW